MIYSGSVENFDIETQTRLGVLYTKHHSWLMACSFNNTKDTELAEDLVQELYLYLAQKRNPKLFYQDSFNLLYCHNFIKSRYINWVKRESRSVYLTDVHDTEEEVYDTESDNKLQYAYDTIIEELERLKQTRMWSSAKLYEMYAFTDITMDELSKKINISKSTTFLNVKKIKQHLKELIDNPFQE